jgi:hypothetical protein
MTRRGGGAGAAGLSAAAGETDELGTGADGGVTIGGVATRGGTTTGGAALAATVVDGAELEEDGPAGGVACGLGGITTTAGGR